MTNLFAECLDKIGIKEGQSVFVHSNLAMIGGRESQNMNKASCVLDSIIHAVGESGSVFLPAFSYSFGRNEKFDIDSDLGLNKMGILSQEAFKRCFLRSTDPMFSVLGFGKDAEYILNLETNSSHGPGSTFNKMLNNNIQILSIATGYGSTLIHEIEHSLRVPYRFMKTFIGDVIDQKIGISQKLEWRAFVNSREIHGSEADFARLNFDLFHQNVVPRIKLGRGSLVCYPVNYMHEFLAKKLTQDEWYLTVRGRTS